MNMINITKLIEGLQNTEDVGNQLCGSHLHIDDKEYVLALMTTDEFDRIRNMSIVDPRSVWEMSTPEETRGQKITRLIEEITSGAPGYAREKPYAVTKKELEDAIDDIYRGNNERIEG